MNSTVNDVIMPAFVSNSAYALTSDIITEIRILNTGKTWIYDSNKILTINRNLIAAPEMSGVLTSCATGMPPGYDVDGPIK